MVEGDGERRARKCPPFGFAELGVRGANGEEAVDFGCDPGEAEAEVAAFGEGGGNLPAEGVGGADALCAAGGGGVVARVVGGGVGIGVGGEVFGVCDVGHRGLDCVGEEEPADFIESFADCDVGGCG